MDRRSVLGGMAGVVGLPTGHVSEAVSSLWDRQRRVTSDGGAGDGPVWVARNREFVPLEVSRPTDSRPRTEYQIEPADEDDPDTWDVVFTTQTTLQYDGSTWNPNEVFEDDDSQALIAEGGWEHQFEINSYAVTLRRIETDEVGQDVWIPAGPGPDNAFVTDTFEEYAEDQGLDLPSLLPGDRFDRTYTGPEWAVEVNVQNAIEYAKEGANSLSINVDDTDPTIDFFEPNALARLFSGHSAGDGEVSREDLVQSLRSLRALTVDESVPEFSDLTETATTDLDRLKRAVEQRESVGNFVLATIGTTIGVISLPVFSLPAGVGAGLAYLGVALGVPGLVAAGQNVFGQNERGPSMGRGEVIQYPEPVTAPTAGHDGVLTAAVVPNGKTMHFSIRQQYDLKFDLVRPDHKRRSAGQPVTVGGESTTVKSAWLIDMKHDETADGPPPGTDQQAIENTAYPQPIDEINEFEEPEDLPPEDEENRTIGIPLDDPGQVLADFRPTASFVLGEGSTGRVTDRNGVVRVEPGTEVTIDTGLTQLGHAPIRDYELFVEEFAPSVHEWQDPNDVSRTIIDGSGTRLFGDGSQTTGSVTLSTSGYYRVSFAVTDENGRSQIKRKELLVTDTSASPPQVTDIRQSIVSTDPDRYRFSVDAASGGSSGENLVYLWGIAPSDDDRFDVETVPPLSRSTIGDPSTFEEQTGKSRRHRMWVLVVDPSTGLSTLESVEYSGLESRDPDDDGKLEDVNADGQVDEADVTRLQRLVSGETTDPKERLNFDFNDDDTLDAGDVRALFEEVDDG